MVRRERMIALAWPCLAGIASVSCGTTSVAPPPGSMTEVSPPMPVLLASVQETAPVASPGSRSPSTVAYREAVAAAYGEWRAMGDGKNADYIPALAKVDPRLYGVVLVTVEGAVYEIGDARTEFSIQSISKPLTLARVIDAVGLEPVQKSIGVNATGQPFNSILAIELNQSQKRPAPGNPFVNAGAIAAVDAVAATSMEQKWDVILGMYSAFAGRRLVVNEEVFRSESETNTHNRAIAELLNDYKVLKGDPREALQIYTRQCSVNVNARDLAVMGATLANGGRNPITKQQVVSAATARDVLAVMATAGMYETTGEWMATAGVPAKSGVGGGIVAVMPGRFAIGTFSPPLDAAGNSVRGQKAIKTIVDRLGGGIFSTGAATRRMKSVADAPKPAGAPTARRGN